MRILLTIVLLMAVAAPASGLDRKPRKKEKKKARTEAVAEPAPARTHRAQNRTCRAGTRTAPG